MKTITIERSYPNVEALDEALRNRVGEQYLGMSAKQNRVRIHLIDSVNAETIQQIRQWVETHDPSVLTAEQETEQSREQNLAQFRSANDSDLDLSIYSGSSAEVQALARKLAWLEQEIRALRGV